MSTYAVVCVYDFFEEFSLMSYRRLPFFLFGAKSLIFSALQIDIWVALHVYVNVSRVILYDWTLRQLSRMDGFSFYPNKIQGVVLDESYVLVFLVSFRVWIQLLWLKVRER